MKKFYCLFFAFAGVLSSLMAQTPAHFDLNVQVKDLGIPTPFGNSGDDDPKRDVKLDLEVTIMQGNTAVYKETHKSVWTNYDGYLSIKVGKGRPTQSSWRDIDWNGATKTIIIKGRQHDQPNAAYGELHRGSLELPTAAYAQIVKPYERPGIGSITLFPEANRPNIRILGNHPGDNFPSLDFASNASGEDQDFVARLHTHADRKLYFFTRAGEFVFQKWPLASQVEVLTGGSAGINLKGGVPAIGFYSSINDNPIGKIFYFGATFSIQSFGQNMALNAGSNSIEYKANRHIFNDGPIEVNGGHIVVTGFRNFVLRQYHTALRYKGSEGGLITALEIPGEIRGTSGRLDTPYEATDDLSIKAFHAISASSFRAESDRRIKIVNGYRSIEDDIKAIKYLKVAKYSYKDIVQKKKGDNIGFIAQEVEKVFPEAVSKTTDVIPDIFQIGKDVTYDNGAKTLTVTVDSLPVLKVGEKVRLIGEQQHLVEVIEINGTTFKVKDWPEENTKEVFVYGRKVHDFRTLDYDQIFTLNVSATQALIKEVEEMKAQLTALKGANESLQSENQTLKDELRKINSRIEALAKMIGDNNNGIAVSKSGTN